MSDWHSALCTDFGGARDELLACLAGALDGVAQASVLRLLSGGARRDGIAGSSRRAKAYVQRAGGEPLETESAGHHFRDKGEDEHAVGDRAAHRGGLRKGLVD